MEKDKAKLKAERQGRIAERKRQGALLHEMQLSLLKQAEALPVGTARSAVADAFLVLVDAEAKVAPDPAHLENRRWEQRAETRAITRAIKPMPPRDPSRDRDR